MKSKAAARADAQTKKMLSQRKAQNAEPRSYKLPRYGVFYIVKTYCVTSSQIETKLKQVARKGDFYLDIFLQARKNHCRIEEKRMKDMIQLIDVFSGRTIDVMIFFLGEMRFMNRNAPCFCGSGKKYKHCHPQINEESLVARLLTIYQDVDERNANAETPCKKGCTECCQDVNFDIHLSEMLTIMEHLNIGRDGTNMKLFPDLKEEWKLSIDGSCLFLNQSEGYCKIYEVRPFVCRNYGSVLQDTKIACSQIYHADKLNLVNENDYPKINMQGRKISIVDNVGKTKYVTMPMTLWFKKLVDEDYFNCEIAMQLMESATQKSVNEFIKVMQSPATKWWLNKRTTQLRLKLRRS
ncbi:MAG: YkgJ family cysteine cluster protein [Defluviitaleaceae bacterium]|nr:YkgJ family cysteine cluster protein [Defluviitaleaceae bacterium]